MHPKIVNPVVGKLREHLNEMYHSSYNSTNPLDFLTISWIVKFLSHFTKDIEMDFLTKYHQIIGKILLKDSLILEDLKIIELEGLFNSAKLIVESGKFNDEELKTGFDRLLAMIADNHWLASPELACYTIFGLSGIASKEYIEKAENYVRNYFGPDINKQVFSQVEILLGIPLILNNQEMELRLEADNFIPNSLRARATFLFVLSSNSENPISRETVMKLTEKCGTDFRLQSDEHDYISKSLIGCSYVNLGLDQVYLLNEVDYAKVSPFFVTRTIVISKRVEFIQEIIVLSCVAYLIYIGSSLMSPILIDIFQITGPLAHDMASNILLLTVSSIFMLIVAPGLLPELSNLVRRILPRNRGNSDIE